MNLLFFQVRLFTVRVRLKLRASVALSPVFSNVLEQDKEHLETTLNTLFTWNETDNQIIVASVEGKEIAEKIDGINVISLSNEKNKLLNESEYLLNQDLINRVIIDI